MREEDSRGWDTKEGWNIRSPVVVHLVGNLSYKFVRNVTPLGVH